MRSTSRSTQSARDHAPLEVASRRRALAEHEVERPEVGERARRGLVRHPGPPVDGERLLEQRPCTVRIADELPHVTQGGERDRGTLIPRAIAAEGGLGLLEERDGRVQVALPGEGDRELEGRVGALVFVRRAVPQLALHLLPEGRGLVPQPQRAVDLGQHRR